MYKLSGGGANFKIYKYRNRYIYHKNNFSNIYSYSNIDCDLNCSGIKIYKKCLN